VALVVSCAFVIVAASFDSMSAVASTAACIALLSEAARL
jgi:hypothetical protein